MDKYYYSDAAYELELNLHNVRRELILMMEVFEDTECSDCFQNKCKCVKIHRPKTSKSGKSQSSDNQPSIIDDKEQNTTAAVTEDDKSTPEKEIVTKNIEAWIEASGKVEEDIKPFPINIKESQVKEDKNTQVQNIVSHTSAVEAFFKYFKVPQTTTNVTYVSATLAAACTETTRQNYSYF